MTLINGLINPFFAPKAGDQNTLQLAKQVMQFHKKIPAYQASALHNLPALAQKIGLGSLMVKDESDRFGLNSFKALGGAYAIGNLIAQKAGVSLADLDLSTLSSLINEPMTFATATAGNHGIGIAWVAKALQQRAVIYMPKDTPQGQVNTAKALNAHVIVTDVAYDETVEQAKAIAEKNGWHLVQDTGWPGYEDIPSWIMQGYYTLASEMADQFHQQQHSNPTHVFLQAGVGSMAGGIVNYLQARYDLTATKIIIAEPITADCLYQSILNGQRQSLAQPVHAIMNGLACAVPNPLAWPSLQQNCQAFINAEDAAATLGMALFSQPLGSDPIINSGPSGSLGIGLLYSLMMDKRHAALKTELGLDQQSKILLINTEANPNAIGQNSLANEALATHHN